MKTPKYLCISLPSVSADGIKKQSLGLAEHWSQVYLDVGTQQQLKPCISLRSVSTDGLEEQLFGFSRKLELMIELGAQQF